MRRKASVCSSPRAVAAGRSARVVVLGALRTMLGVAPCVAGCGDPSGDEETSVGTEPATSDPSADGPGPTTAMTDADSTGSDDAPPEPGCGNGVLEGDEQCDDGVANSDTEPDACRTDCRVAHCADGVIDPAAGEECDDGSGNSAEPNACRDTCLLPTCGDGTQDQGEACDDGNTMWGDTCQACSNLYYFVLNTPDGADPSIVRSSRDSAPQTIVGGDPSLAGLVQLAIAPGGAQLFALQETADGGIVHAFDPDGAPVWQAAIDMAALGYAPVVEGFAVGSDGLVHVVHTGMGNSRLAQLDPATMTVTAGASLGGELGVLDVVADDAGALYLSTSGGQVMRVDLASSALSTFGDGGDGLATPIGLAYDPVQQLVWVANNPGGQPSSMVRATLAGAFTPYSTAGTDPDPFVRGVAIDVGGVVLTAQREYDRIVAVQNFDAIQPFLTEMIDAPLDLVILDMAP